MKLNKKQEKAIRTATDALNFVLTSGLCSDEDGSIKESIEELVKMREKSLYQKAKEKARQKYLTKLFETSEVLTLDAKWYDENVRKPEELKKEKGHERTKL